MHLWRLALSIPDGSDMHSFSVIACDSTNSVRSSHHRSIAAVVGSRHVTWNGVRLDIKIKSYLLRIFFFLYPCSLGTLHTTHHPDTVVQPACVHPGGPAQQAQPRATGAPGGRHPVTLALHAPGHRPAPQPSHRQAPDPFVEPCATLLYLTTSESGCRNVTLF